MPRKALSTKPTCRAAGGERGRQHDIFGRGHEGALHCAFQTRPARRRATAARAPLSIPRRRRCAGSRRGRRSCGGCGHSRDFTRRVTPRSRERTAPRRVRASGGGRSHRRNTWAADQWTLRSWRRASASLVRLIDQTGRPAASDLSNIVDFWARFGPRGPHGARQGISPTLTGATM